MNSSRESEFTFNYKIPRKNGEDTEGPQQNSQRTILSNAYDNAEIYQRRYMLPQGGLQRDPQYQNSSYPLSDYDIPPTDQVNPLKRPREVPKNNSSPTKYGETFPQSDPTLPKELTQQFQPLFCKLCTAKLSSNVMAKLHYKSKKHEKRIRAYLVDYSKKTGEPLHEKAQVNKKQKCDDDNDPKFFHCDVCDLPLTGKLHAESHYMGKNHHRALAGKAPAGKGHFSDDGKWVRSPTTIPSLPSDRDNIGLDFAPGAATEGTAEIQSNGLHCEICDVNVTSEQQMTVHLNGQKHKRKVQQQADDKVDENPEGNPENNILSTLSSNVPSDDLSVYRTPSGYYYCNPCNLSLNSEIQFSQHLGSKKHRKKANSNKE